MRGDSGEASRDRASPLEADKLSYGRWAIINFSELIEADPRPALARWHMARRKGVRNGQ